MVNGKPATALKNKYGARLGIPEALIVDTHAIGRGATMLVNRW
ncbi:MAG: hypothetical protein V7K88_29775 [Nostoc sp.]